jgi:hypothetical protein
MGVIAENARSVATAVVPLAVLFMLCQIFLLDLPRRQVADVLKGTVIASVGLFLFLLGASIAFLPFGRAIGAALGGVDRTWLVVVGLVLGFITAWAEPSVRILADQAEEASNGSLPKTMIVYAICAGVAVWVAAGMLRISYGIPLMYLIVPAYLLVIVLLWFSDGDFLAVAVDSGGVATGPLANSFLLALALGAASANEALDPLVLGFGFVALIAVAPVISVMMLGLYVRFRCRVEG